MLRFSQRLRRSNSLALLKQIEKSPFTARENVSILQWSLLSEMLNHAEKRVPYYRELFRSLGITSGDIRSLNDFAQLPVLTKDIIRERQREMVREDVPIDTLLQHHSGGSTGIPLSFYREREYIDMSDAGTFRNLLQAGWIPGEMIAFFWGATDRLNQMSRWQFELRQALRRMYQFDPFHSGPTEMSLWLKRWGTLRPAVALGYASTIARFAEFIERGGQTVAPLRGVFTTAEKLYPAQRETISRVFGCQVFDLYGSSEVQNIAAECAAGSMHINADFVVVETDDQSINTEGAKPLILTSLQNFAMPFIRYRNEDCGDLVPGHCSCGNNFPLMRLNISRVSDNFVLPGGRVVHGEFFTHLMYGTRGIANFQFHQTARDAITLWVVPGTGEDANSEAREAAVKAAVRQIRALDPDHDIRVDVRETEALSLSGAGKHRFTRSDIN